MMPLYSYKCPDCGTEEDRIVSLDERDDQWCSFERAADDPCQGKLEREEIALTARMPDAWKF